MARPQFAPAADEAVLGPLLDPLLSDGGGRWQLTPDGHGLERSFAFKTFAKAWVRSPLPLDTALSGHGLSNLPHRIL